MMKYVNSRLLLTVSACLIVVGCKSVAEGAPEGLEPMSIDSFALRPICYQAWSDIFTEWAGTGGSVLDAVENIRSSVNAERRTKLSILLRRAWDRQAQSPDTDPKDAFADAAIEFVGYDCSAISWPAEIINATIYASDKASAKDKEQLARAGAGLGPSPGVLKIQSLATLVREIDDSSEGKDK